MIKRVRAKFFFRRLFKDSFNIIFDNSKLNPVARFFKKNESWILVLQTILIVITVYFTYRNIMLTTSGQRATEQYVNLISNYFDSFNENFSSLNDQFIKMEENISRLPNTVAKLDSTSEILGNQMVGLGENLAIFKVILEDINAVAEKQLGLIKETQRQWEAELKKKPDLVLFVWDIDRSNDTLYITPGLINKGEKPSLSRVAIIMKVPKYLNFYSDQWTKSSRSNDQIESWSTIASNMVLGPKTLIKEDERWTMQACSNSKFSIIIPPDFGQKSILIEYLLAHEITQIDSIKIEFPKE
jgi:hypothetical protein